MVNPLAYFILIGTKTCLLIDGQPAIFLGRRMDNAIAKYISTWKGGTDENPDYRMLMDYKVLFCGTIFIRRVWFILYHMILSILNSF